VPALRILDDGLWDAVKARQGSIRASDRVANARATRFWDRRRSRHLLSGLVRCQECGGLYASIGRDYLACSAARGSGTCSNRESIRRAALEGLIIDGLRQRLMAPEFVEEFIRAFQNEINLQRRESNAVHEAKRRELADVMRKLDGLIDAIADGLRAPGLQHRLDELEARRNEITQDLSSGPTTTVRLHPNLAEMYRRQVERLQHALNEPEIRVEALSPPRSTRARFDTSGQKWTRDRNRRRYRKMVDLGIGSRTRQTALDEPAARSVKVVAGTRNQRCLHLDHALLRLGGRADRKGTALGRS